MLHKCILVVYGTNLSNTLYIHTERGAQTSTCSLLSFSSTSAGETVLMPSMKQV